MMLITFSNGEERLFDASILKGEVFEALEDENNFRSAYVDHGVITWMDGEIDCAPEYMYQNSYEIEQAQAEVFRLKDKYDAAVEELNRLQKKKQELQRLELLQAIEASQRTYDEIMAFLSSNEERDEE